MRRIFTLLITSFCYLMLNAQTQTKTSGSQVNDNSNGGTVSWTNITAVNLDDGNSASASLSGNPKTQYLVLKNFGFTVPTTASITGIEVFVKGSSGSQIEENAIQLIKNNAIQATNKSTGAAFSGSKTYGGNSDLWNNTWSVADINDAGFGVAIAVAKAGGANTQTAGINFVTIKIYYGPGAVTDVFTPDPANSTNPISGNVLANDTDPFGGTLSSTLVTNVDVGNLLLNSDGSFTYTPPATGFRGGLITFTYRATSSNATSAPSGETRVSLSYIELAATPVNFISFNASKSSAGTQLTWKVGTEENVSHYEIERSNGSSYVAVGSLPASGLSSYTFTDPQSTQGTVLYRIRSVDNDGKYKYSTIISLKNGVASIVLKAFPIPALNTLTVQHPAIDENGQITLTTAEGKVVKSIIPAKGSMQTEIKLDGLTAGIYLLRFNAGDGKLQTLKIMKQ